MGDSGKMGGRRDEKGSVRAKKRQKRLHGGRARTGSIRDEILVQRESGKKDDGQKGKQY